jgi:hypothetical protein
MVLNALGEASNQRINVPSHVLADNRVISILEEQAKTAKVQGMNFKRKSRTRGDNLGLTVSEDPQKAILVAFG